MAENRDARFESATVELAAHVVAGDLLAGDIVRALGDDDDVAALAHLLTAAHDARHLLGPLDRRRALGNEDPIGSGGRGALERQPAAVAAHDLDHKVALVRGGGRRQRIDSLHDSMQRTVAADRHVGASHVVVDAAHQSHDTAASTTKGKVHE